MKKIFILLTILAFLIGGCARKKSCSQRFYESYDKNLEQCVNAMVLNSSIDTIAAEHYCSCMLNQLFALDSTIVNLPSDSLIVFIRKHQRALEEICKPPLP